jgi:integrase
MAVRMVALNQLKNGQFLSRKVIPVDVRDAYARLYRVRREAQFRQPADTPKHEAKARHAEWTAEIETRIATLRAEARGEGRSLTKLNAIALGGRWYNWFVGQHKDDPGPQKRWREMGDHLIWNVIYPEAPEEHHENGKADPHWEWAKEPEVREAIRPQIAELARVATFLASEGHALNAEAYALFVDAVSDNLYPAIALLERHAAGDYSPDSTVESFPAFTDSPKRIAAGLGCWQLFEAFVKTTKPADQTVQRWRAVFLQMQRDFADVGANGITEDAARSWVAGLVSEKRSAETVREAWLAASRSVFSWAARHKHVHKNPFIGIKVDVRRKARNRETKAFRPDEATIILTASLAYEHPKTAHDRARRWAMWLCAYTGARSGEITQLRGIDVEQRGDFHVLKLTPDAGTIKTRKTRIVPIHEHIIEQGFLDMVRQVGTGPLFYNPAKTPRADVDPLKPSRSPAATARAHLSTWVRKLGVKDPEVSPTHAWRHTFKQMAARTGISENVHDEITGHAPASEGRKYTTPTVEDMAAALKKFPRYDVEGPPGSRRGETKKRAPSSAVGKSNNGNRVSRRRNHNDRFA